MSLLLWFSFHLKIKNFQMKQNVFSDNSLLNLIFFELKLLAHNIFCFEFCKFAYGTLSIKPNVKIRWKGLKMWTSLCRKSRKTSQNAIFKQLLTIPCIERLANAFACLCITQKCNKNRLKMYEQPINLYQNRWKATILIYKKKILYSLEYSKLHFRK